MYKKNCSLLLTILCTIEAIIIVGLLIGRYINFENVKGAETDIIDHYNIDRESYRFESYEEFCDYLYQLDICMLYDERSQYSNYEKVLTVGHYVDILNHIVKYYYEILLSSENELAVSEAQNAESEWNESILKEIDSYQAMLEQQYGGGTIIPLLMSKHQYMLYRSWAMSAFELYLVYQV